MKGSSTQVLLELGRVLQLDSQDCVVLGFEDKEHSFEYEFVLGSMQITRRRLKPRPHLTEH